MKIHENRIANVFLIQPEGRIDANSISEFSDYLNQKIDNGAQKIVLDFSKTDYLSSAGIRALMAAQKRLDSQKGLFALCSANENLQELFRVVQIHKNFSLYDDDRKALVGILGDVAYGFFKDLKPTKEFSQ